MPRRTRAVEEPVVVNEPHEEKKPGTKTLVISNISKEQYQALLLRTFKKAASGEGRVSVAQAAREIIEDWFKKEGSQLFTIK